MRAGTLEMHSIVVLFWHVARINGVDIIAEFEGQMCQELPKCDFESNQSNPVITTNADT